MGNLEKALVFTAIHTSITNTHSDECQQATKATNGDCVVYESMKTNMISDIGSISKNNSVNYQTQEHKASKKHKPEVEQGCGTNIGCQEKVLKRPDKALSCPRCNSFETKFCYFNNYNVNQPRHCCKNCQRYWTAGGAIRNVPVGAGRRKNKLSSLQYQQGNKVDGSQDYILNSASQNIFSASSRSGKGIGGVKSNNGSLYESMEAMQNTDDQEGVQTSNIGYSENVEEPSSSSSAMASTAFQENDLSEKEMVQDASGLGTLAPLPLQGWPGPMWAYPWNPVWNMTSLCSDGNNLNSEQWGSSPMLVTGFCTPTMAIPFGPASFLASKPGWEAEKYNMPLFGSTTWELSSSSTSNSGCLGSYTTLGKHYREPNSQSEEQVEKFLWAPKTLRIGNPNEAAKSSLWATLGMINPDKSKPIVKSGIFKVFQQKPESCSPTSDAEPFMQANPAALSRSQTFQEST